MIILERGRLQLHLHLPLETTSFTVRTTAGGVEPLFVVEVLGFTKDDEDIDRGEVWVLVGDTIIAKDGESV